MDHDPHRHLPALLLHRKRGCRHAGCHRGPRPFAHFDLYRIHTEGDLAAAGFYDYLDMGAVVACEWSENCAELLDLENPLRIHIERVDETTRKITIG